MIHAYDIAYTIATDSNLEQKSPLTQDIGIKAATVNFISETEFYSQIQAIRDELRKQLDDACGKNQTKACLEKLCTSLSNFNSNQPSLPFYYPFNKPSSFTSQRLTIENSLADERRKGSDSAIKAHHLNVRFEGISQFDNNLLDSLKLYIDNIATPDSEDSSLDKLLNLPYIEKTYVRGSLLIVPLSEKLVKETNYIDLEKIIDRDRNEDFIRKLKLLVTSGKYPKQITSAAYSLIDLARTLFRELERSQKLSQTSLSSERYYALPIQIFISFQAFEQYFENERRVSNSSFRDILARYVYSLALAYNILPIDSNYQNIPYVVFNSGAMDKLGKSLFNENQIFQSKEMNILNLILSQEE